MGVTVGFERRIYKLVWPEGSAWHGLEVRMRPMSVGTLEEVGRLYAKSGESEEDKFALLPALAGIVQQGIVSWNLTDDGIPVPCTDVAGEGVELVTAILQAWQEVVNQVNAPLPQGSPSGEPSPEALIPMEIPSASHANLSTPN